MSWKPITDGELIRRLATECDIIGARYVLLGDDMSMEDYLEKGPLGMKAKHRLAIRIYDVKLPAVSVYDEVTNEGLGFFVWTGSGGRLRSSGDPRLVELANRLDVHYGGGFTNCQEK